MVDGVLEVIDIIGDVYGVLHMRQFNLSCGYPVLWLAFAAFIAPALLSSMIALYEVHMFLRVCVHVHAV